MFTVKKLPIVELYITSQFAFFFTARRGFGGLVGIGDFGCSVSFTAGVLSGAAAAGVGGGDVRLTVECLLGARGGRLSLVGKVSFQIRFVLYLIVAHYPSLYAHPK